MIGRRVNLFAFALLGLAGVFSPSLVLAEETPENSDANPALTALEEELARMKAEHAKAARAKQGDTAEMWGKYVELIEADLDEAKRMIAEDETFDFDTSRALRNDREKAVEDWLARRSQAAKAQIEAAYDEARREHQRGVEAAEREYGSARQQAVDRYRAAVAPAELLLKFQTSGGRLGIVLWNMPGDGSLHNRVTKQVGVTLLRDGKPVWRRKSLKLSPKQADTQIPLPQVLFDEVVIDVMRWKGEGGGLAEVEVYVGKENVALGRPCQVTSLETLPAHLDDQDAVTDGITFPTETGVGYWIPEAGKRSSVRINLLGAAKKPNDAPPAADVIPRLP